MARKKTGKKTKRRSARKSGRQKKASLGRIWRGILRVAALVLVVLLVVTSLGGAVYGLRLVLLSSNPRFCLETVTVVPREQRDRVTATLRESGISVGSSNLFAIDTGKLRELLEEKSTIDSARITRILPGTLKIELSERYPFARLKSHPSKLITAGGVVLPDRPLYAMFSNLPEITGIRSARKLEDGEKTDDPLILAALRFLNMTATRQEGQNYDVATIQLDSYLPSLTVYLREKGVFSRGSRIKVPVDKMEAALDRLKVVIELRRANGRKIDFADATHRKNMPVKP